MDGESSLEAKWAARRSQEEDLFDTITSAEERIYLTGLEEGARVGAQQASLDGWRAGIAKGATLGAEIGKYDGFCTALSQYLQDHPADHPTEDIRKLTRQVERVQQDIKEFPKFNVKEQDLEYLAAKIKSQVTVIKSSLRIAPQTAGAPQKYSF